ncbi:MAG: cytochrome c [Candidatus Eremiobacteraeota bacterium]|nr:cytochrome c [Candidatus Eremiobacteraeota bacterium]MCW5866268.1 cytochrome c [Candidatus Eremiobacteraeota bacterium]
MRLHIATLALALVGCSSGSGPSSKPGKSGAPSTPRPQAAEFNMAGGGVGSAAGVPGPSGGSGTIPEQSDPGSNTPSQAGSAAASPLRRPPIEPGLWRMPGYQPSLVVVNPGSDTLARGYNLYMQNCAMCHGADLRGEFSASNVPVRDLTRFKDYKFGSTDQAIYRSIVYGIPKTAMGSYQHALKPQQVWDLINFMKSKRTD